MSLCYLNGEFLPLASAKVSVLDRGFMFGDGVYEVIPVFAGRPFRLDGHLARLARSLAATGIPSPLSPAAWTSLIERLVAAEPAPAQTVYVQITRGVAPRHHLPPPGLVPTVFVMSTPLTPAPPEATVSIVLREDFRWTRCDIKSISLLGNVLLRQDAAAAGADEAVLVREGLITEGASSNVFMVRAGRIRTPPLSNHLLPGVTRDLIVELMANTADAVLEADITREDLLAADEIWLASSGRELAPVSHVDGQAVGHACPGPVYRRVVERYAAFKSSGRLE
jgi:D-alanine transaminase